MKLGYLVSKIFDFEKLNIKNKEASSKLPSTFLLKNKINMINYKTLYYPGFDSVFNSLIQDILHNEYFMNEYYINYFMTEAERLKQLEPNTPVMLNTQLSNLNIREPSLDEDHTEKLKYLEGLINFDIFFNYKLDENIFSSSSIQEVYVTSSNVNDDGSSMLIQQNEIVYNNECFSKT